MEITLENLSSQWPDRDAGWFYTCQVIHEGTRYPVLVMIDGPTLAAHRHEMPGVNEDIVETFYREELEALVRAGRLKPREPNVVFCVEDDREQVRAGDVVVDGTCNKLTAIVARATNSSLANPALGDPCFDG